MSTFRTILIVVALILTSAIAGARESVAQPVYASPFGYVHDIPYFATNLLPGETVDIGIWLEMLRSEPEATIQYHGELGSMIISNSVTASGPSFNLVLETVATEAIMAECRNGWIQVNEKITQQDDDGNFSILLNKRENTAPCSWASTSVTPMPPVQLVGCGDDNDTIQIGRQVPGLSWDEGVWKGNTRTVTFRADPGYTLVGQSVFTYVDSGSCTVGPAGTPTQTFVCGANNDRIVLGWQPPHVILTLDSGWIRGQRTIRYEAEHGYTLDGSGEFRFTDQSNRLCPQPWPTSPVVVQTPRATLPPIDIRPTPWPGLIPRATFVPTPPRYWTPSPEPPSVTPTPWIIEPIPLQPTPRGFPLPRPTIGAFTQVEPTTTRAEFAGTDATTKSSESEASAMMALAPAAIALGLVAAFIRRHDS